MPTPSKFTAARRKVILEAKQVGASGRTAAQVAGISHETLRSWLERGRKADEGAYAEFAEAYEVAEAEPKLRALGVIWRAMPDKPDLAWKFIERREQGFAPPQPGPPPAPTQVLIQLGLNDGRPAVPTTVIEGEDVSHVLALPDSAG